MRTSSVRSTSKQNARKTMKLFRYIVHSALYITIVLALSLPVSATPAPLPKTPPASAEVSTPQDATSLWLKGYRLSAKEAKKLETQLSAHPDNLAIRTELIGYYQRAAFSSPEARIAHQKHILWIINNRPDSEVAGNFAELDPDLDGDAFTQGKNTWLKWTRQYPKDTAILSNAAHFLLLYDKDETERLLQQAQALEPKNPEWPNRLGELYSLQMPSASGDRRQYWAKRAFMEREVGFQLITDEDSKYNSLSDLAKTAFEAGEFDKARTYATDLLERAKGERKGWNYGNAIHFGNLVLGRIALKDGDLEKAKAYLLASGKTPGSPQLDSFGPNMLLAKDLLEKGERKAVLQYFDECATFWKRPELKEWTAAVKLGKIPDFGGNLDY